MLFRSDMEGHGGGGGGGGGGPSSARRSISMTGAPGRRRLPENGDYDSPRRPSSSRTV